MRTQYYINVATDPASELLAYPPRMVVIIHQTLQCQTNGTYRCSGYKKDDEFRWGRARYLSYFCLLIRGAVLVVVPTQWVSIVTGFSTGGLSLTPLAPSPLLTPKSPPSPLLTSNPLLPPSYSQWLFRSPRIKRLTQGMSRIRSIQRKSKLRA